MTAAMGARKRMEGATLASIAIHIAVAIAIPALALTIADSPAVETVSFTHVLHVQIVRPHAPMPRPRAQAPHHSVTPVLNFAHRVTVVRLTTRRQSERAPVATNAPAAPSVSTVAQAGAANSHGGDTPATDPSPAVRNVASVGAHRAGGYLPFGAEQPVPVLDPGVLKQLNALGTHVTLLVTVGDDGRTTNIVFQPSLDAETENKIRNLLADANWDPAVCGGGVACEAQATIKL